jgi:hypothetical protein
MNTALWVYSHIGSVGNFAKRWWQEVKALPSQIFNIKAYGLFAKKLLIRIWKNPNDAK